MNKEWNGNLTKIDAVVMLTWSDWFTEPISNRYHYAIRFAKYIKVIFIQPDIEERNWYTEPTEFENITVLHVLKQYNEQQGRQIDNALLTLNIISPLFWIYNVYFAEYIKKYNAPINVFHATEDYLLWADDNVKKHIYFIMEIADIVIGVSKKVLENYNSLGIGNYKSILLENGVDYNFWHLTERELREKKNEKIMVYQGGINYRLDFELLDYIAKNMPDWKIQICGRIQSESETEFQKILKENNNIEYMGFLSIKEIRKLSLKATVGLIPFFSTPSIYNSLPLKAFEYMATGLSIVSVPVSSLENYSPYIHLATSKEEFVAEIEKTYSESNVEDLKEKLYCAKTRDYDNNFLMLLNFINNFSFTQKEKLHKKINILYDEASMKVFTIKNYLEMFARYSHHEIVYTAATGNASCGINDLDVYDAVIIFYSIRVCFKGHLARDFEKALSNYHGHTILLVQDDYDNTEETRKAIKNLKIDTVYTVVPQEYIDAVYPSKRFPNVNFFNIMTGYISDEMKNYPNRLKISDRSTLIGYRARELGYWYGNLAREKLQIGVEMRKICKERGLNIDIEWESDKRIYTEQWLNWLASCKATLGTESGSNIFDDKGKLKKTVEKKLSKNPNLSYPEIFKAYLSPYEGIIKMNQVSPKMFEAISLKTALILFEGDYSGILKPELHYIPLKKDFSNIDDVLSKVLDDDYLQNMVDMAYEDIMSNYKLSYQWLIQFIDKCIDSDYILFVPDANSISCVHKIGDRIRNMGKRIKHKLRIIVFKKNA